MCKKCGLVITADQISSGYFHCETDDFYLHYDCASKVKIPVYICEDEHEMKLLTETANEDGTTTC